MPPAPPTEEEGENAGEGEVGERQEDEKEKEIDENDPLWKATLKVCNNNRAEALKMLEDPDALLAHPEVVAFLEKSGGDHEDEWEMEMGSR